MSRNAAASESVLNKFDQAGIIERLRGAQVNILNGVLEQEKDLVTETKNDFETVTKLSVPQDKLDDLVFANKLVKHTKSNTIVLAKNGQLLASGTGQTSRVDALRQAIHKAKSFVSCATGRMTTESK